MFFVIVLWEVGSEQWVVDSCGIRGRGVVVYAQAKMVWGTVGDPYTPLAESKPIEFADASTEEVMTAGDELETLGWGLAESSINEPELIEWIVSHS